MSVPAKTLVIGDLWTGPLFAHHLQRLGQPCELWVCEAPFLEGPEGVYLGNGETRTKAALIFGEPLAAAVWSVSEESGKQARALLTQLKVPFFDKGLVRESGEREPGGSFSPTALAEGLKISTHGRFSRLESVTNSSPFDFRVRLKTSQGTVERSASMAVVVTEQYERDAVPWLADKRIPVTLSSFIFPPTKLFSEAIALFNAGADFATSDSTALRLGSFRNLFADHGVGLHTAVDPRTRDGVLKYFAAKGWIDAEAKPREGLRVESISCDGLPIVGTIPGLAGVFFVTGFAARGPCFLFSVAERVAHSIVHGGEANLGLFSPRRLL